MEAHWRVTIHKGVMTNAHYYWVAVADQDIGVGGTWYQSSLEQHYCFKPEQAVEDWEEFATRNFITSYELVRNQYTDDILNKEVQWKV